MISLSTPDSPLLIEAIPGIVLTCRPVTSLDMATAKAAAQRTLESLASSSTRCFEAGMLPPGKVIDLSDQAVMDGLFHQLLINEIGKRHILEWEGVTDIHDQPVGVTPERIVSLLAVFPIGQNFYAKLLLKQGELLAAKKGSGPAATGTTSQAAAPDTAQDAGKPTSPAAGANQG